MRIVVSNTFYTPYVVGGAELSVQGIAEQLASWGDEVFVLTTGAGDEDETLNGVKIMRRRFAAIVPYMEHRKANRGVKKILNKPLTIDNPLNARIIRNVLHETRAQVVLSNNLLGITPELWRVAYALGIPVMHTVRDYALLCPNSTMSCRGRDTCGDRPKVACQAMRCHLRHACRLVSLVSAPSSYPLKVHRSFGFFMGVDSVVIPNAVHFDSANVNRAVELRRLSLRQGPLRVAYLGRLIEEKGVGDLLEAIERLGHDIVELHVAGTGPFEQRINQLASAGVMVTSHGFLDQEGIDCLLQYCDVLVAPSRVPETFGRVVLDACRNAMPVIVTSVGALPEIVRPGMGTIVPPHDPVGLAKAMRGYADDRERICREGEQAALVLEAYTVQAQAASFRNSLSGLLLGNKCQSLQ